MSCAQFVSLSSTALMLVLGWQNGHPA